MANGELLIVDDQAGVRLLLYEVFIDEGFQVSMASGGWEAVAIADQVKPNVILLDMKMPDISGLETIQELEKIKCDAAVVMMTAYGELDIVLEAKNHGVEYYINKPFDLEEIRGLVKTIMSERGHSDKRLRSFG